MSALPDGAECVHSLCQLAPHNAMTVLLFRIKMKSSIPSAVMSLLTILSIRLILLIIVRTLSVNEKRVTSSDTYAGDATIEEEEKK